MGSEPIDLTTALAGFEQLWSPRIVTRVNDYDVRIAKVAGEHVWHAHDHTDEFFLVLDGELRIALRDGAAGGEREVVLGRGEVYVVPRGGGAPPVVAGRCVDPDVRAVWHLQRRRPARPGARARGRHHRSPALTAKTPGDARAPAGRVAAMTAQALAGALADDVRRKVFAAVVLGAGDAGAVADRTGLTARQVVTALRRLRDAGLLDGADAGLRVDADRLREAARTAPAVRTVEDGPDGALRPFLRDGTVLSLPAQHGRRRLLLAQVATSFEPEVHYPERDVDDVLRGWCAGGRADHVSLRRYLVDEGFLARERGVYRRAG
ncbi:DUF2087 domain-containing protein [Micromonospora sp. NPDC126480]|uniref:DUF2087 domain-containing protein n=1 Tax=Micromonospora sp. NPDC126480 TaxID=3155312 RepID=UPI003332BEE4